MVPPSSRLPTAYDSAVADDGGLGRHPLVGQGREAEIYAWDDGTVLRLLRPGADPEHVQREESAMRAAGAAGVDVPRVHGRTTVDGRPGLIMDRVDGRDLITVMGRRPWTLPGVARIVGREQAAMHEAVAPPELWSMREMIRFKIETADELPADLGEFALGVLDTLPDGDRLCHGDFHPGNILLGERGPSVIDWTGAARGDPAADLARSRLLLRQSAIPEYMPALIRRFQAMGRRGFFRLYLRAYARARPIDSDLVDRWEIVRVADRIWERIEDEQPVLLAQLARYAESSA
jgi:aminoglycoside phosphotransferase (APT) family kinase protein